MATWGAAAAAKRPRTHQAEHRGRQIALPNADRRTLLLEIALGFCQQDRAAANARHASRVHTDALAHTLAEQLIYLFILLSMKYHRL